MRRLSRDSWLAIGIFALLLLVTIAAAIQQGRAQARASAPPLSPLSSTPRGARALWLWLEQLEYRVSDDVGPAFDFPEETRLILMLEPTAGVEVDEWKMLDRWVDDGGVLVLAGDGLYTGFAARHYGFDLNYQGDQVMTLTAQTPLLVSPPVMVPVAAHSQAFFTTERDDYVTFLASGPRAVLVSFTQGKGRVILSAAPFSFSNAGLKEQGNPALVLNVVSTIGGSGLVWFDEWHHGVRLQRQGLAGPGEWLRYTWAGNALLYAAGVILLGLVLRGRRFGRPVPLPHSVARRSPLEYITAVANLYRRAGHRQAVLRWYHLWLKRELGKRYRLGPTLPDEEYVQRLAAYNPSLDAGALRSLLGRLSRSTVSEGEMVRLAAETAEWLSQFEK